MADTIQINTENLRHGSDCPAFNVATINKGTPARPQSVPLTAGQLQLTTGTVEFRHRSTGAVLASMPTTAGATLTQAVGDCTVFVTPDNLRPLVELEVYTDTGLPMRTMLGIRTVGPYG